MSTRRRATSFNDLKRLIFLNATTDLLANEPDYVSAFRESLDQNCGDAEAAHDAAKHLLRQPSAWRGVLTALFDVEMSSRKLIETNAYLLDAVNRDDDQADSLFQYHMDHWFFQVDAYIDRGVKLLKKLIRQCVADPTSRAALLDRVTRETKALRANISRERDKLAHGGGGGLDGTDELWELVLAVPEPIGDGEQFFAGAFESRLDAVDASRRRRWYRIFRRASVYTLAFTEAYADVVMPYVRSHLGTTQRMKPTARRVPRS